MSAPIDLLEDYFTRAELLAALGVCDRTLRRWEDLGAGPPATKLGRRRLYRRDTARAWLRSREAVS